jgi:nanoRNase/pAp phosphatase (c-di-AMP/oligoRNAs hydrolase)
MGLSRGASPADAAAYFFLQPQVNVDALVKIERAQVPPEYFKSFAATLGATRLYDGVVIAYAGAMDYPDLAAEMADLLTRLEGAQWVICMGAYQDVLYLSVRSHRRGGGAGRLVHTIVAGEGSAGGHGAMAGGQVPLQGQQPEAVFWRLSRRALEHLGVDPAEEGRSLL